MYLVHSFGYLNKAAWKHVKNQLTCEGLSNEAYDICGVIYKKGSCNQDYVVKALQMDKSSTGKIIRKCENKGLLTRTRNEYDRRNYDLVLTEYGVQVIEELISAVEEWQNDLLNCLSDEEKEQFLNTLTTLTERI